MSSTFPVVFFWMTSLVVAVASPDWPQFLGPHRNGVYDGTDLAGKWPASGPPVRWREPVGHGFAGPVVVGESVVLFARKGPEETVTCFHGPTGKVIWSFGYPTTYEDDFHFDDGPRATPCIYSNLVYTFGAQGSLHCLDLATGTNVWSADTPKMFDADKGFFGMACSPLVEGDVVLLNIGGPKGAGIVAFDRLDGHVRWKASNDEASYSSPVSATIGERRSVLFFTRNGLVAVEPLTGAIQFEYPWHSGNRMSVNAATPLVLGNKIFLSACYGTGAVLLTVQGNKVEKLWSGDDLLSNHYATSIEVNGLLYGINGRTDPGIRPHARLRCVDIKKKKVCWETDSIGTATLTRAADTLFALTETGELVQVAATPERFEPKGRVQLFTTQVRAFPALASGLLFARSKDELLCLDLRETHEK
jgi:outer membrane protein assembly factor BamB